ncbi:MAG: hypothetical protein ACK5RC_00350 [Curvibacter sp.]|jgi:hypothetical protein|nr:hypothetical protein [Curvibacter sp.]
MPYRPLTLLLALLAALPLTACSTRAWYEVSKASAESECRKLPPGGYEECMGRVNRKSYEDYDKERQRK